MSSDTPPSFIESEFSSAEAAYQYDRWYRAKVQASVADMRPRVAHEDVMAQLRERILASRQPDVPPR